jgi:hypothetical protein
VISKKYPQIRYFFKNLDIFQDLIIPNLELPLPFPFFFFFFFFAYFSLVTGSSVIALGVPSTIFVVYFFKVDGALGSNCHPSNPPRHTPFHRPQWPCLLPTALAASNSDNPVMDHDSHASVCGCFTL